MSIPSSPAVPRSIAGCGTTIEGECPQDEGVKTTEELKKHRKQTEYPPPPLCFDEQNIGEVSEGRRG